MPHVIALLRRCNGDRFKMSRFTSHFEIGLPSACVASILGSSDLPIAIKAIGFLGFAHLLLTEKDYYKLKERAVAKIQSIVRGDRADLSYKVKKVLDRLAS